MSYPLSRIIIIMFSVWGSFDKAENIHPDEGGHTDVQNTEGGRYKHKVQGLTNKI